MDIVDLRGCLRSKSGKGSSHTLRRSGEVPGVVYGKDTSNLLVEFSDLELNDVIKNYGEHAVLRLEVNGSKLKTMIKEVQREPVNRKLMHVDLKYVNDSDKVHTDIPVVFKGEDLVRSKGGVVQKQMSNISIETTPDNIPKYIVADVSGLKIGGKLIIADVELSSDITVTDDINSVVAIVTSLNEKEKETVSSEEKLLDNDYSNEKVTIQ